MPSRSPSTAPRTRTNPEPSEHGPGPLHLQIHDVRRRTHRPFPVPAPTRAHRAVSPLLDQRDTAARNSSPRIPVRDGPPRYCGTGPAGSPPAGDGHELPRLPSGANFMSRLPPQPGNRSHSLGNGDGQRPNPDLLLTMPGGFVWRRRIESDCRKPLGHRCPGTSRYACRELEPHHLASHLILEPNVRKTSLSWSPVTESNRRPSPYHGHSIIHRPAMTSDNKPF
jgi:hypothetical protein